VVLSVLAAGCSLRSLDDLTSGGPADAHAADGRSGDGAPVGPRAILVVGGTPLSAGDHALEQRLKGHGLDVMVVTDDKLDGLDTAGAALIFVSRTEHNSRVTSRFRDVTHPVVICDPYLFNDMGMIEDGLTTNRGVASGVSELVLEPGAGALAGGLSGTVTVTSSNEDVGWGSPNANAIRVASVPGQMQELALFAYDQGAAMYNLTAPARRVGIFLSDAAVGALTAKGWTLVDAALAWAVGPP
jgi:hypothetical protein